MIKYITSVATDREAKLAYTQFEFVSTNNHIYYSCVKAAKALKCTSENITYKL
jgi:hypothetical protein